MCVFTHLEAHKLELSGTLEGGILEVIYFNSLILLMKVAKAQRS